MSSGVVNYLKAHQGNTTYLVAAVGSNNAASIALQSGRNVVDMGGFGGSDPAPSLAKLKQLISSGQLHYILLSSARGDGATSSATTARDTWIKSHATAITIAGQNSESNGGTLYYVSRAA